jgi:dihydrofolate synthase/folylpolyglutamate synthase
LGGARPARRLTYEAALAEITGVGRFGIKLGLERTRAILAALGNPQAALRGALVAGTNGKGSVCAFLAAILEAGGLRSGRLPSPHLSSYRERILVGEEEIGEADFAAALDAVRPALRAVAGDQGDATEFEILTSMALWHLAPRIDRLVCEVGLGGRLDVTNVLDLGVAVITNVSLDHVRYLGTTIEAIAAEKAAIIKPGNAVVTGCRGSALAVVERMAEEQQAQLWRLGRELRLRRRDLGWQGSLIDVSGPGFVHRGLHVALAGSFQAENAALAVAAAEAMADATTGSVAEGLPRARWPGRLERVPGRPVVILDGGHNPEGLRRLASELRRLETGSPLVVVFGAMADKDLARMLAVVRGMRPAAIVFTRAASAEGRAAEAADLLASWERVGSRTHSDRSPRQAGTGEVAETARAALERAQVLAGLEGTVLVCGSLYLVGELRPSLTPAPAG